MDMAVVTPVFSRRAADRVLRQHRAQERPGRRGSRGRSNAQARELFQEGIQYPPIRLVRRGECRARRRAILRANSRTPHLVLGDIRGQVGVARLGERRLAETIARYGLETAARGVRAQARRDRAARSRGDRGLARRRARRRVVRRQRRDPTRPPRPLSRAGHQDRRPASHFDFTGCDDQAQGPINIQPHARARLLLLRADRDRRSATAERRRRSRASSRRRFGKARSSIRTSGAGRAPTWRRATALIEASCTRSAGSSRSRATPRNGGDRRDHRSAAVAATGAASCSTS